MNETYPFTKDDLILSRYDIDRYCFEGNKMVYRSEFDYELTRMIETGLENNITKNIVFILEDNSYDNECKSGKFLIIPLHTVSRSDNTWLIQRGHQKILSITFTREQIPIHIKYINQIEKHERSFYQKAIEELKIVCQRYSEICIKTPKQMRRIRNFAFKHLDRLLPTDLVHTIIAKAYYI